MVAVEIVLKESSELVGLMENDEAAGHLESTLAVVAETLTAGRRDVVVEGLSLVVLFLHSQGP